MKTDYKYLSSALHRFWSKVDRSEDNTACWNWTGGKDKDGYGFFYIFGQAVIASRFIYELAIGPIPKGMIVCHHCDNPSCCNPSHLFIGTHSDNAHDAYNKGRRSASGFNNGRAILTENDVKEIRSSIETGKATINQVAARFNISQLHVTKIVNRKRWQHI